MESDYIIVNKTTIQKRIEELKKEVEFYDKVGALSINPNRVKAEAELSLLQQFLSQSNPLIPEIEKAFDAGREQVWTDINQEEREFVNDKKDHISNLKLDI